MKLKHYYLISSILFVLHTVLFVSSSWLVLLRVLELVIIILLFIRLQPLRRDNLVLFRYFLLQTLASMCLVCFFIGMFNIYIASIVIFFKLVIPPFHIWLLIRMKFGDRKTFYWVMVIIKLPVIIILQILLVFFLEGYGRIMFLMITRGIISLLLLWTRGNLLYFLIRSSFLHTLWTVLRLLIRKNMFLCYYSFYALVLFILIWRIYGSFEFLISNEWSWDVYLSLFIFSGAPPSFMFLMKWTLLLRVIKINIFMFLLFLLFSGMSLYLYFRIIFTIMLRGGESLQIFKKSNLSFLVCINLLGFLVWTIIIQLS